jgi:hypothetical protein
MVVYVHGDGTVVMASGSDGAAIADEVLRSVSKVYGWPDYKQVERTAIALDSDSAQRYVGKFGFLKVASTSDGLSAEIPLGSVAQRIYPDAPDHFFILGAPTELIFGNEDNGQMTTVDFITPMAHIPLKRDR